MSEPLETRADEASDVSEAAREANQEIAAKALRLHFLARVPFICECSDPDCRAFLLLLPQQYADARSRPGSYLTLPDHNVADADPVVCDGYWLHTAHSA